MMGTKVYDNALDLITFTRASKGTSLRPISYGPELVTNGTFDTDTSGWTVLDGTLASVGGECELTYSADTQYVYQAIPTEVGKVYTVSADMRSANAVNASLFVTASVFGGPILASSGESPFSASFEPRTVTFVATSSLSLVFIFSRLTSGTAYYDNISVKEVLFDQPDGTLTLFNHPNNIPRIEYAANGTVKGLLIEEQRTNLIAPSNDFSATFVSNTGVVVSSDFDASPDGGVNADKLAADTSTGFHRIAKTGIPTSSGVDYSFSCFFKAAGETVAGLALFNGTNWLGRASIDLETGVASVSNGSAKVDDYGNGWYRLTIYGTSASTSHTAYIYVKGLFSETGNGVDGVLAYGAQLEAGSFPTSYIPTSGATATREPDIASIPVTDFGYNQKAGTVVVEFDSNGSDGADYPRVFVLSNTSGTDLTRFLINPTNTTTVAVIKSASGVALTGWSGSISENVVETVAVAIKKDSFAASLSGASTQTDTSGDMPAAADFLAIGTQSNFSNNYLNGHIKSLQYYPRRLTNTQLQELTS